MEQYRILNSEFPIIFPEKTLRHENCKPCKKAYLFFPKPHEMININEKNLKESRRRIFEGKGENQIIYNGEIYLINYLPHEIDFLNIFFQELEKHNQNNKNEQLIIPGNFFKFSEILKFLQSTSFDNLKTINFIIEHIKWKQSIFPLQVDIQVEEILNYGFIYVHGRDNCYRPIIVMNVKKCLELKEQKISTEKIIFSIIYLCEYVISNMLIPGQIETWNLIVDLNNVRLFSLPSDLSKILTILQKNYRGRLNSMLIIGMSKFLTYIWSFVKSFFDPATNKKIKLIHNLNETLEFINPEQLEKKYSGSAENKINDFFPPIIPSENFTKEDPENEIESVYEDAKSIVNGNQQNPTIYENCKESNKSIFITGGNESDDNYSDTNSKIYKKDFPNPENVYNSNYDTNIKEEYLENNCKVRGNNKQMRKIYLDESNYGTSLQETKGTPHKNQNENQNNNDSLTSRECIEPSSKIEKSNDINYEGATKQICCASKQGKCFIF